MEQGFVDRLKKLIAEQGKEALLNVSKCKPLLADYTRGEYKKESRLLVQAVEAGIAQAIDGADELEPCKKAKIRDLEEEHDLKPESATDIVNTLALVLRGDTTGMTGERLSAASYFNIMLSQHREGKDNRQWVKASAVVTKKPTETSALAAKKFSERGEAFYKNGDYNNAIKELNEAIRLDPNNELAKSVLQKIPGAYK